MSAATYRDHRASILVTALGSAFGVAILSAASVLGQIQTAQHPEFAASGNGSLLLTLMAVVFLTLALYVGAIVTANTFATIVAGRTSTIALMRLLGATAASQRRAIVREGFTVGVVGSVVGGAVGAGLGAGLARVLVATGAAPDVAYRYVEPSMLVPPVAVVIATIIASRIGSRGVLRVSPVAATTAAQETSADDAASRHGRHFGAMVLFAIGTAMLIGGVAVGLVSPVGVLIGLVGGVLSFSGVVAGSSRMMPACLRLVGRALGRGPAARLAAANAVRHPDRSARSTIGLVIGVTLVTTFAVALTTIGSQFDRLGFASSGFGTIIGIFTALTGFSAVIAAVGMVNSLSLSVLQRRRELGLLRTLGFTAGQIRGMILAESVQLSVTAIVVGLILGTGYGWSGAQAMLGSLSHTLVPPTIPIPLVVALVVIAFGLAAIASIAPSRRATRVSPVEALRVA